MAICVAVEKLLQEATGIRRGRVHPVAKNTIAHMNKIELVDNTRSTY